MIIKAIQNSFNKQQIEYVDLKREISPIFPSKLKTILKSKRGSKDMYILLTNKPKTSKSHKKVKDFGI